MAEVVDVFEMTPMQSGMLFHTLMEEHSGTYFEQCWCRLDGHLDVAAFQAAWQRVIARHAVLRGECHWVDLDRPVLVIHDGVEPEWHLADWTTLDAVAQEQAFADWLASDRRRGFRLDTAPLMRFALFRVGPDSHRFVWSFHHLLMDGWCGSLLVGEMLRAYAGRELPPSPAPYRRYVEWLAAQDGTAARAYWSRTLADLPEAPVPELAPLSHEAAGSGDEAGTVEFREVVDPDLVARLTAMARRERLTLATVLQGAWALLLSRYSGTDDVVFGTVLSGRPADLPGADAMIGLFLNTVPLRVATDPARRVAPFLRDLQAESRHRERHGHAALTDLQRWSRREAGQPLFETLLIIENLPLSMQDAFAREAGELALLEAGSFERTHYSLALRVFPGTQTVLALSIDTARVAPAHARQMLRHYQGILSRLADAPEAYLGDIELLADAERGRLLEMGRGPAAPAAEPIPVQVSAHAARTPDKTAVAYAAPSGDVMLSYRQLEARSEDWAARLRTRGIGRGAVVAVCLRRGPDLLVTLLAVLKSGAAYLPIDPGYPAERIGYMLADSTAALLLTDLAPAERPAVPEGVPVIALDEPEGAVRAIAGACPSPDPEDLAYILYTSGSTGQPKGVAIQHRALSNFITAMAARPGIDAADRLLALTTIGFDIAGLELFGPLARGATVLLADTAAARDGARLVALLRRLRPSLMQATPAGWRMLVDAGWEGDRDLRMLCGGEALDGQLAAQLLARGGELWNLYGPTETTIWSAAVEVRAETLQRGGAPGAGVPVAGPIDQTMLYVLDPRGLPVPVGIAGELHIAGAGLSPGYWGKPSLTAERFVPNPFRAGPQDGLHLYRTGDLVRWRADGALDFLGRMDSQIKLRGYRIELGEIEARLSAHPLVAEAAVLAQEGAAGMQLVAYLRWAGPPPADPAASLRDHLGQALPAYMVPAAYVPLERFPLTPNGKVDRKALPALRPNLPTRNAEQVSTLGEPAATLAALWCDILKVGPIAPQDNFFALGGHSLLVIALQNAVRQRFGITLDITDFFRFPTLQTLATRIAGLTGMATGEERDWHDRAGSQRAGRARLAQRRDLKRQDPRRGGPADGPPMPSP